MEACKSFLDKIRSLNNHFFQLFQKDLKSPWITTGIKKSSKWKQVYRKNLKKIEKVVMGLSTKIIKNYLNQ